jgi:mRNA-degrading endonuclease RelE of RelBE toxin-antitoxin system
MSYEILRTDTFSRHLKQLSKKHFSLKEDYVALLDSLQENPKQGTPLGKDCYKLRMKISSKNTGKSGGARVITLVKIERNRITLLDIYDKSEKDSLTDKELDELIKQAPE